MGEGYSGRSEELWFIELVNLPKRFRSEEGLDSFYIALRSVLARGGAFRVYGSFLRVVGASTLLVGAPKGMTKDTVISILKSGASGAFEGCSERFAFSFTGRPCVEETLVDWVARWQWFIDRDQGFSFGQRFVCREAEQDERDQLFGRCMQEQGFYSEVLWGQQTRG